MSVFLVFKSSKKETFQSSFLCNSRFCIKFFVQILVDILLTSTKFYGAIKKFLVKSTVNITLQNGVNKNVKNAFLPTQK